MSHLLDNAPFWEKKNQKLEVKVGSGESSSSISSYYANGQWLQWGGGGELMTWVNVVT